MASVQVGKPAINRIGLTVQDGSRHGQLATSTSVARHRTRTSGPPSRAERHLGVRPADHPAWTGEGQAGSPAPPIGTLRDPTRSSLERRTPSPGHPARAGPHVLPARSTAFDQLRVGPLPTCRADTSAELGDGVFASCDRRPEGKIARLRPRWGSGLSASDTINVLVFPERRRAVCRC
jgi:hypothetical protein